MIPALSGSLLLRLRAALAAHGPLSNLRSTSRAPMILGLSGFLLARTERHGTPLVDFELRFGTRTRAGTVHLHRGLRECCFSRAHQCTRSPANQARTIWSRTG